MKKYRKLACILAGSMTMSLFAGCIGNGDVVPEEKNESTDTEEPTVSETSQEIKKAESRDIDQVHLRDKDSLYETSLFQRGILQKIQIIHGKKSIVILSMIMKRWEWTDIRRLHFCR